MPNLPLQKLLQTPTYVSSWMLLFILSISESAVAPVSLILLPLRLLRGAVRVSVLLNT